MFDTLEDFFLVWMFRGGEQALREIYRREKTLRSDTRRDGSRGHGPFKVFVAESDARTLLDTTMTLEFKTIDGNCI